MDLSPLPPRCRAVALLIDGQNTPPTLALEALIAARGLGPVSVQRVYGDARTLGGWHEAPGFRLIHAHAGKNVTDMMLCVEAMELALTGAVDGVALVSSDRDFAPLAQALRARGLPVLGLVGPAAPPAFRLACSRSVTLTPSQVTAPVPPPPKAKPAPSPEPAIMATARKLLATGPRPNDFGQAMKNAGHTIPEGSARWRDWLTSTFPTLTITGDGQEARFSLSR